MCVCVDKYVSTKFLSMHKITYNIIFTINVTTGAKKHHIELAVFGYNKDNTPGAKRTYINQNNLY